MPHLPEVRCREGRGADSRSQGGETTKLFSSYQLGFRAFATTVIPVSSRAR